MDSAYEAQIPLPKRTEHGQHENLHIDNVESETLETQDMSATQNFFDNPQAAGGNTALGAGFGGLIGAALGNGNGLFGGNGNRETATLDQVDSRFNALQGQMSADQLQSQITGLTETVGRTSADSTIALGVGIAGVKDAVVAAAGQNALALCNLGHSVQTGIASVNQNILLQGAASRELALQQALDAERTRATELRIALSECKNQAGHTATQVLLNQVIVGNSGSQQGA